MKSGLPLSASDAEKVLLHFIKTTDARTLMLFDDHYFYITDRGIQFSSAKLDIQERVI